MEPILPFQIPGVSEMSAFQQYSGPGVDERNVMGDWSVFFPVCPPISRVVTLMFWV